MSNCNLLDLLSEGRENAKTARELMLPLGFDNVREVAAEIARLRKAGTIICSVTDSDVKGYYLPSCRDDIIRFVRKTESRIRETEKMLQSARDFLQGEV